MKFERRTEKRYYEDFFLCETLARIVKIGPDFIETDATVAYPEGGGQEADLGTIEFPDGQLLRFIWAKKMYAHSSSLPEFPDVKLDGVIWHMIHPDDIHRLATAPTGAMVTIRIDRERRARLSLSHTASHLLYLAVDQYRPDAVGSTIGCHIKPEGARFDFAVASRISSDELMLMEQAANTLARRDLAIHVSAHVQAPDARLWHCDGKTIPCGGTHLDHTGPVGMLRLQRQGLGTGKERIACTFEQASLELHRYHY